MHRWLCALAFLVPFTSAAGADPEVAPGHIAQILQLEAGGPTSPVNGLAFSPDGKRLYVAGWDKVVRVYSLQGDEFKPDRDTPTFRVPIGPGLSGALYAMALSDDGQWLAAAGQAASRRGPGFQQGGIWAPALGFKALHLDEGTIYVFNTRTRAVRLLRGHEGFVEALAFAPTRGDKTPLLCSVAREQKPGRFIKVARVWDLDSGASRLWREDLPGTPGFVGLTVWHGGEEGKDVWAAISAGDKAFRASNLTRRRNCDRVEDLVGTVTAVAIPGEGRCLTACFGAGQARLRTWEFPREGNPKAPPLGIPANVDSFPRGMALCSSRGDGKPDRAAVALVRQRDGRREMRLQLLDLTPENRGAVRHDSLLWPGGDRDPILATSQSGRHLAVAGNKAHEVWIFPIDARGRPGTKPQVIASAFTSLRHVSFVKARGKEDLGLLLNRVDRKKPGERPPVPDPRQQDWVFDFKGRSLTDDPSGWETVFPDTGPWSARLVPGERSDALEVYRGRTRVSRIGLPPGNHVADYALLGPAPHGAALVAVAAAFQGQPNLTLYNAETGERVRHFTGHAGPLSAVAFSPDGRFLASAADDQTVRVWSLLDLKTVLNVRGGLSGVAVQVEGGDLTVASIQEGSPAEGQLRKGDVITAVGTERRLASPYAFYFAFHQQKPGTEVDLLVRREGRKDPLAVKLKVAQGIDERKPFFSLAITREGPVAARDWIGWNPFGPYETSTPRAEQYLGWLFNTGDVKEPTRFGTAKAHHNKFYRKGLLHDSILKGEVITEARLPLPEIGRVVAAGQDILLPDGDSFVSPHSEVDVLVSVQGRELHTLEKLTWKLRGEEETRLPLDARLTFPLKLKRRHDHHVTITAYTSEVPPKVVTESLVVRHQPPRPVVLPSWKQSPLKVSEKTFTLQAMVEPALPDEGLRITVYHRHKDAPRPVGTTRKTKPTKGLPERVEQTLTLLPGENILEVEAVHLGADREGVEEETGRATLVVDYTERDEPPAFTFAQMSGTSARPFLLTDRPAAQLTGAVSARKNLEKLEWDQGVEKWVPLDRFKPDTSKEFPLKTSLMGLKPGRQTFQFRAKSRNSEWRTHGVVVEYRPQLPGVVLDRPAEPHLGVEPSATYELGGSVTFPTDRTPFQATLLVNDREQAVWPPEKPGEAGPSLTIDERTGKLRASVTVRPQENRIEVRLTNRWKTTPVRDAVRVWYGRPPRVEEMKRTAVGRDRPTVDVEAVVWSPEELIRESLLVTVNDQKAQVGEVSLERKGLRTLVKLRDVMLEAGKKEHKIRLQASNKEAAMPKGQYGELVIDRDTFPPATAVLRSLDRKESGSLVTVVFGVRSESRLRDVKLLWGPDHKQQEKTLDLEKASQVSTNTWEFREQVELLDGRNFFTVRAVNLGGQKDNRFEEPVAYTLPPIRLVLDQLRPGGGAGVRPIRGFTRDEKGWLVSPQASNQSRVTLEGRILWVDETAHARSLEQYQKDLELIRVYANGFQQSPARVLWRPGPGKATEFTATVVLNRAKDNEIHLWAEQEDPNKRVSLRLDCTKPATGQRLHLLVMSPTEGNIPPRDVFHTGAFSEVFPYGGPLVGNQVTWAAIRDRLEMIKEQVYRLAPTEPVGSDVVLIYYQGTERPGATGAALEARPGLTRRYEIQPDALAEHLAKIPGAHILLLDVERPLAAQSGVQDYFVNLPEPSPQTAFHVSVLRYSWTGTEVVPDAARMIVGFRQSLQRHDQLAELVRSMEGLVKGVIKENPRLIISKYVPPALADLRLGR